jgi:SPP1 family predicted phage head-tail adaptor
MVLKSGEMRDLIEVQTATRTSDNQGGFTSAWSTTSSEWTKAIAMSQNRSLDQGGIKYKLAVEFTMRKRTALPITGANRIVWNSENYTIHSVVPSKKFDEQIITAYV